MKRVMFMAVCLFVLAFVSEVSAITVDLSSPQEGVTLAPGDSLELDLTVTNDSDALELAVLRMDIVGKGSIGNIPGISHKPIRLILAPGESVTKVFELVFPDYKLLPPGEYIIDIAVIAYGRVTETEATDTITLVLVK